MFTLIFGLTGPGSDFLSAVLDLVVLSGNLKMFVPKEAISAGFITGTLRTTYLVPAGLGKLTILRAYSSMLRPNCLAIDSNSASLSAAI